MKTLDKLGQNLKALRMAHKLSLRALAVRLGVHFTTIGSWERGTKQPRPEQLEQVCKYFKISMSDLWK
jgi:transcriptional regulator with XRE-family HTH domain